MDVPEKVDKLKKETIALRKEMIIMKTLVKQQNELIKVLLENSQADEAGIQYNKISSELFPIQTQEQLDKFEKDINRTNRKAIIYEIQRCLRPEGLSHNLHKIISEELIVTFNLDGNYNKGRLLDYENLMTVLFKATEWDHGRFIVELRHGMRKIKKRILKRNRKKSLVEWNDFQKSSAKSDDTEEDNDDNDESNTQYSIKTENWFPIRTQDQLDKFEKTVNLMNRAQIVEEARLYIQQGGLGQAINKLIAEKLIINYNLEGKYNKRRLLDYDNLLDVLFKATKADGWDHDTFIAELRKSIRLIKKRRYKLTSRKRKSKWSDKSDSEDDEDDDDNDD